MACRCIKLCAVKIKGHRVLHLGRKAQGQVPRLDVLRINSDVRCRSGRLRIRRRQKELRHFTLIIDPVQRPVPDVPGDGHINVPARRVRPDGVACRHDGAGSGAIDIDANRPRCGDDQTRVVRVNAPDRELCPTAAGHIRNIPKAGSGAAASAAPHRNSVYTRISAKQCADPRDRYGIARGRKDASVVGIDGPDAGYVHVTVSRGHRKCLGSLLIEGCRGLRAPRYSDVGLGLQ